VLADVKKNTKLWWKQYAITNTCLNNISMRSMGGYRS